MLIWTYKIKQSFKLSKEEIPFFKKQWFAVANAKKRVEAHNFFGTSSLKRTQEERAKAHYFFGIGSLWRTSGEDMTGSVLNYIFAIESLGRSGKEVRSVDVSQKLNVARSSVSKALDKLTDYGYALRDEKGRIKLTSTGERTASEYAIAVGAISKVLAEFFGLKAERAYIEAVSAVGAMSEDTVKKIVSKSIGEGLCR